MSYAWMARRLGGLAVAWACLVSGAMASQSTITATYKGSVTRTGGQFTNTTPQSGICADYPSKCSKGYFSILFPWPGNPGKNIGTDDLPYFFGDLQDGFYIAFNATQKTITVSNERGLARSLAFNIDSIGFRNGPAVTGPTGRWDYNNPQGQNCTSNFDVEPPGKTEVYAVWSAQQSRFTECAVQPVWSPQFSGKTQVGYVSFRYRLKLDKPWTWEPGTYRGSVVYRYGSGQDIYFGKHFTGGADDVTLDFVLTVQPDMYISFPGDRGGTVTADLVPPGGWFKWQGAPPPSLAANVPFDFGTLGSVKIGLQCQYPSGDTCGIVDLAGGPTLAVDALLTDSRLKDASGRPALDSRLTTALRVFSPLSASGTGIVPARLVFRTQPGVTKQMQAGHQYGGVVTIVFDSDVS